MDSTNYQIELIPLAKHLRRSLRLFQHLQNVVTETELAQLFRVYAAEHENLANRLYSSIHYERLEETPTSVIQLSLNVNDLLKMAAQSEQNLLEQLRNALCMPLPDEIRRMLEIEKPRVLATYDYVQALSEVWT